MAITGYTAGAWLALCWSLSSEFRSCLLPMRGITESRKKGHSRKCSCIYVIIEAEDRDRIAFMGNFSTILHMCYLCCLGWCNSGLGYGKSRLYKHNPLLLFGCLWPPATTFLKNVASLSYAGSVHHLFMMLSININKTEHGREPRVYEGDTSRPQGTAPVDKAKCTNNCKLNIFPKRRPCPCPFCFAMSEWLLYCNSLHGPLVVGNGMRRGSWGAGGSGCWWLIGDAGLADARAVGATSGGWIFLPHHTAASARQAKWEGNASWQPH